MTTLSSSSRLKTKRDTYFLPDPKGIYLRNNTCSFRLEGKSIYQWVEKLIPLFNGEKTMGELTEGLTEPYRNRVYEIGETLYKNGFVRDISQDRPHQLSRNVLDKHASQIEFIDSFLESGAFRFQQYQTSKVLVIGSDEILASTVFSLIESGLSEIHVISKDSVPKKLNYFIQENKKNDKGRVNLINRNGEIPWGEALKPYDWILYVSQEGNIQELKELNQACKEERKAFLPVICLDHVGLAGPLVQPGSEACWESAWRRIHKTAIHRDMEPQKRSITAGAILANAAVFELFKKVTGISSGFQCNQIYLLDLETLEGDWHVFLTHPLVNVNKFRPKLIEDLREKIKEDENRKTEPDKLLTFFHSITSAESGIFHLWEEGSLPQLPLSQCYVQAVNPCSKGPAEMLPKVLAAGLTHEEARREAAFKGIEMYVSKMIDFPVQKLRESDAKDISGQPIGIGAGETITEAVCRGLQDYLEESLKNRKVNPKNNGTRLIVGEIDDHHCRYYFKALKTLNGTPSLGLDEDILGFPVIWVKSNGRMVTKPGLTTAFALRNALYHALLETQNQKYFDDREGPATEVFLKTNEVKLEIPSCDEVTPSELLSSAIEVLKQKNRRLCVYDLAFEPFLMEDLAGVFGVQLREGGS